jgi:hypothetical protein
VQFGEQDHFAEKIRPDFRFRGNYHIYLSVLSQDLFLLVSESKPKLAQ